MKIEKIVDDYYGKWTTFASYPSPQQVMNIVEKAIKADREQSINLLKIRFAESEGTMMFSMVEDAINNLPLPEIEE